MAAAINKGGACGIGLVAAGHRLVPPARQSAGPPKSTTYVCEICMIVRRVSAYSVQLPICKCAVTLWQYASAICINVLVVCGACRMTDDRPFVPWLPVLIVAKYCVRPVFRIDVRRRFHCPSQPNCCVVSSFVPQGLWG